MFRWQRDITNKRDGVPLNVLINEGEITVAEFLATYQSQIIQELQPQTFNLQGRRLVIPSTTLYQIALLFITREYGNYPLDNEMQNWLMNDLNAKFPKLLQLLSMESPINLNDILRNNYGHRSYRANSSQGMYEAMVDSMSEGEMNAIANMNSTDESDSTTLAQETANYNSGSTMNSQRNYTGNTDVANTTRSNDVSRVGQINQHSTRLDYEMPRQAIVGNTTQLPIANSPITNQSLGIPSLQQASARMGQQASQVTEANTTEISSQVTGNVGEARRSGESNSATETYNSNSNNNSQAMTNSNSTSVGESNQSSYDISTGQQNSKSQTRQAGAYGTRESGFTTTAVFAQQFKTMWDLLMANATAWDWWLDQFHWIEGVI